LSSIGSEIVVDTNEHAVMSLHFFGTENGLRIKLRELDFEGVD